MSDQFINEVDQSHTTRIQYAEPDAAVGANPDAAPKAGFATRLTKPEGFFGKLFDMRFSDYATPSVVKVVYWIAVVMAAFGWIYSVILAFAGGWSGGFLGIAPFGGIGALLLGWIPPLFSLILLRILLEAVIALIRLSKDTRRIRHYLERGGSL